MYLFDRALKPLSLQIDASDDDSQSEASASNNTSIKLVLGNKGRYRLLEQPPRVRKVAKDAISCVESEICLKNAFPDGPEKYDVFARRILVKCAEANGDRELAKKLKDDADYAHDLASIVSSFSVIIGVLQSHTTS